jgi:hypothetical protein
MHPCIFSTCCPPFKREGIVSKTDACLKGCLFYRSVSTDTHAFQTSGSRKNRIGGNFRFEWVKVLLSTRPIINHNETKKTIQSEEGDQYHD